MRSVNKIEGKDVLIDQHDLENGRPCVVSENSRLCRFEEDRVELLLTIQSKAFAGLRTCDSES